nr:MAG TPA: hypothetical protein [Bacteriophage sp.]
MLPLNSVHYSAIHLQRNTITKMLPIYKKDSSYQSNNCYP